MTTKIPSLWPKTINVDAISPRAILQAQATELARQTQGLLEAEISERREDEFSFFVFEVVAPVLADFRQTLLELRTSAENVYPATVIAPCYSVGGSKTPYPECSSRTANTYDELMEVLKEVFSSCESIATLTSLIARSNEAQPRFADKEPAEMSGQESR